MCALKRTAALFSPEDPFGELKKNPSLPAGLRRRFNDRVLIMTTSECFARCPHCTRAFILGKTETVDTEEKLEKCVQYVKKHPEIRDVLLSGGDVLTLSNAAVKRLVNAFASLEQIDIVRICTRALVDKPERVTDSLARLLARSGKVWANVHINTAAEAVRAAPAAARLVNKGIPVSSQTVLLKGVNDTPEKMLSLLRKLSAARIRPYYVFQCDPVAAIEKRFGVPLKKAKAIEKYCAEHIGGLSLPRFVADLPSSLRKTPLDLL